MTEILEELNSAKVAAMKLQNSPEEALKRIAELRLTTIRSVLSEIDSDSKAKKPRGVVGVLKAEHSKRVGSATIYGKIAANEESSESDRASAAKREAREIAEAAVVAEFMPAEPTESELRAFITSFVIQNGLEGSGNKGPVMKALREEFASFDGKLASTIAAEVLA